jgi:hypothetical protein
MNDTSTDQSPLFITHVSTLSPSGIGTLTVSPDGSLLFRPFQGFTGVATFTYQPFDGRQFGNITTVSITVGEKPPPIDQNDVDAFAVGAGSMNPGRVTIFNHTGTPRLTLTPFPGSASEVRVAIANGNGDTTPDVFVATGPGTPTRVAMIDGAGGRSQRVFTPFEDTFTGGAFVAAADLDGDGIADLAVAPDVSGGPRVILYSGRTGAKLADFFGIEDKAFRGGARLAFGDINGDGTPDLIVAAGMGGGPRVAVWDGVSILQGQPRRLFNDFFVFEDSVRNGVYVATGDINGDGCDDILIGGGPGGGPRVIGLDGLTLLNANALQKKIIVDFFAGDPVSRDGVRLTVKNLDGDNHDDLIVATTGSAGPGVFGYYGQDLLENGTPTRTAFNPDTEPLLLGGIFVG